VDELETVRTLRAEVSGADADDPVHVETLRRIRALAESERTSRPAPRTRVLLRRRRMVAVAAAAAGLAAAIAFLPGQLSSGKQLTLLDRAAAAVSTGPVLHVVLQAPLAELNAPGRTDFSVINLQTGQSRPVYWQSELWFDPARKVLHQQSSVDGAVLFDSLESPSGSADNLGHQSSSTPPTIDPALAAFLSGGYAKALQNGTAEIVDHGTANGRAVTWLRFPPPAGGDVSQDVAVDNATYQPVLMRAYCPKCTVSPTFEIESIEGVASDAANFTAPAAHDPHPVALYDSSAEAIDRGAAAQLLGRSAFWAGEAVGSLPLAEIERVDASTHSAFPGTKENEIGHTVGLRFTYGGHLDAHGRRVAAPDEPFLAIAEAADYHYIFSSFNFDNASAGRPLASGEVPIPPDGEAVLTERGSSFTSVQMKRDGLYVEVDGNSRQSVLATAQALQELTH
jgi:hypothetical protein